ncbi:MAG: hypothetical protein JNL74_06610, partial [Fibrobacteres bacterium]|nr:hypothetical protein [Fibrobacterota bacterium]
RGTTIQLDFSRGDFWMHETKMGAMTLRITPQLALWAEDELGNITTLFVTNAFGKQDWKFAKINPDSCGRSMCMPYWLNRLKAVGASWPTKNNPLPDAVTGATPTGSFSITVTVPDSFKTGKLYVEINKSFDNNDSWPAKKDAMESFNGQPPLVYETAINLLEPSKTEWQFVLSGFSGNTVNDPSLYPIDNKITTAKEMIKTIKAIKL